MSDIINDMLAEQWFDRPGAYVLVDGQFGSTGKGLLAGYLAEKGAGKITHVTTNAGPNSGHTAFFDLFSDASDQPDDPAVRYERICTQQLPVASVFLEKMGHDVTTLLNGGAIIHPATLLREVQEWFQGYHTGEHPILVHPAAAIITQKDIDADNDTLQAIAGTGKGVGASAARKMRRLRDHDPVVASDVFPPFVTYETRGPNGKVPVQEVASPGGGQSLYVPRIQSWDAPWDWSKDVVFVETAQGFSLGINSAKFYPHTTSRETTVMQALADARIPAQMLRGVVMTLRTFPIRVGNTAGSSGDCYSDQEETTWEALGLEPELTTVTKRVRRVFTWSRQQFKEAVAANMPDMLFLNFCNYLDEAALDTLVADMLDDYREVMGGSPDTILLGYGPHSSDIRLL
jgi:adenylosuccinate synthase